MAVVTIGKANSFYVHCPSNVDAGEHFNKTNTSARYTVPLSQPVFLTEDYEVGLAEVFAPSITYNIAPPWNKDIVCWRMVPRNEHASTEQGWHWGAETIRISRGQYSPKQFCAAATRAMEKIEHFNGKLVYHRPSRRIEFHLPPLHRIEIVQKVLQRMMGKPMEDKTAKFMVSNHSKRNTIVSKPWGPVDFNNNGPFMYIYSDVALSSHIGNTEAPVLRAVSLANMLNETEASIHREYQNIQYYPIRHTTLDRIQIRLCNSYGEDMPFVGQGKTLVVLHFRKKEKVG